MKTSARLFTFQACVSLVAFSDTAIAAESSAFGNSVAAQRDGKIVVAGYATVGRGDQFALVRYNSDGSLDTSLNSSGKLTTAVGTGTCKSEGVALQGDGKIVVAGYSFNAAGQCSFTVLRYRTDGSLDATFADSGKVTTSIGGKNDSAESVVMQSDGKIVVAGYSFIDSNNNDFAVVRYNPNGTLDPSFNETGKATADFGARDLGRSVAIHRDGRIVVAGYTTTETKEECALACFKANGSLDTSFNGTGKVTTNFGGDGNAEGQSVAMQIDGKIIVVGFATVAAVQQFAVARYNADGTLDTSFGGTGRVVTAVGISGSNATGVALQKDGKIVVSGYGVNNSGRGYDFACLRYNTDGSLDEGFGDHGKVTTVVGQGDGKANSLAVQTDGKIIVAGSAYVGNTSEFAVVRYNASGKLDMSFNAAGSVLTAVGSKPPEPPEAEYTGPHASMAEINDPHGYTNVTDDDGKVIAKVKNGERFIAAKLTRPDDPRWSVRLKSRVTGFMDKARIHLLPNEPLMKLNYDASKKEWRKWQSARKAELDATASAAKRYRGVNYYKVLTVASNGDKQALAQFFSFGEFMEGGLVEGYWAQAWELFHVVGDKNFSNFVRGLPLTAQVGVRGTLLGGLSEEPFLATQLRPNADDVDYLRRYFPETTKILFRGEIVDWISPDGRYAIRKTFTNPLDLSESVSHAELIEKATGQVLCDLTDADIGVGSAREGSVLWSPDSKRFAYVASDQTTVYQSSGKSFTKINLPLDQPPGKESDPQIRGAVMGEESVTPTRWAKADTLIFERIDHYDKLNPSSGNTHVVRTYEITVSFKGDGTANTSWKLRNDR